MANTSSPKIHPASGTPFVDCSGVTEKMGLPIYLDDFLGVTTEVGLLVGLGVSASCFVAPICFFFSWCSSRSGTKSLEPLASVCCTYGVVGFLPCKTGGRQLCRCSWNLKKLAISSGDRACI
jgi:hypothetical protein